MRDPGQWVHRKSGVPLGGIERTMEFTIIGCVESPDSECSHRWECTTTRGSVSRVPETKVDYGSPVAPTFPSAPRDHSLSLPFRTTARCAVARAISVFLRN